MKMFSSVTAMIKNEKGEYEGIPALRGVDSYELARKNGFEGSEEEWLDSIIGDGWVGAFQQLESRTVNGHPLSANVELTTDDIPLSGNNDMSISEAISAANAAYLAFVGNVNTEMVEAAFGKYNEENIIGLGRALAMVANYKAGGEIDIKTRYPNLYKLHNIKNIQTNVAALNEIAQHELTDLMEFLNSIDYAREMLTDYLPLHYSESEKYCVNEIILPAISTDEYTIPIEHSGYYSIYATLVEDFNIKSILSNSTAKRDVCLKVNGISCATRGVSDNTRTLESNIYLTPEDVVTVCTVDNEKWDELDSHYNVHVRLCNSYSGCNCIPNLSEDDDTSKVAFGVTLTPNEAYSFEGPSGYYRVHIPKWMVGCYADSGLTALTKLEFSLKFGDEVPFYILKEDADTFLETGEYDEIRYIERGEEILLTSSYTKLNATNEGAYMSSILFYNSTGAYPLLDNIKPIETEEASE